MRILFHVGYPLEWAPGGYSTHIRRVGQGLMQLGVEVAWLHAESDAAPHGDIIQYWGLPPDDHHAALARGRQLAVCVQPIFNHACDGRRWLWSLKGLAARTFRVWMGRGLHARLGLEALRTADAVIFLNRVEAEYARRVYGVPGSKAHVVSLGVDDAFMTPCCRRLEPAFEGLIYPATIRPLKNNLEVAMAARKAGVRIKFVGAPAARDGYWDAFTRHVDNQWVFWEQVGSPDQMCSLMKNSRGVVLASRYESQPLVIHEALALGVPVLAARLPTLTDCFGPAIRYCSQPSRAAFVEELRAFWAACQAGLAPEWRPRSWLEVAQDHVKIYQSVLSNKAAAME
jgi:glycosyltransferase involved in cell wall biosynthesis